MRAAVFTIGVEFACLIIGANATIVALWWWVSIPGLD
jgi:hypothetical protein